MLDPYQRGALGGLAFSGIPVFHASRCLCCFLGALCSDAIAGGIVRCCQFRGLSHPLTHPPPPPCRSPTRRHVGRLRQPPRRVRELWAGASISNDANVAIHASRFSTRPIVVGCHRPPHGVPIPRCVNSAAICRNDAPLAIRSASTGWRFLARSTAAALFAGASRSAPLRPSRT